MATATSTLSISRLPADPRSRRTAEVAIGLALQVALADAQLVVERLPVRLPKAFSQEQASALGDALRRLGTECVAGTCAPGPPRFCPHHPSLFAEYACEKCSCEICAACARRDRDHARCPKCSAAQRRSKRFYLIRVSVLLTILLGVLLYAWLDVRSRRARIAWERPLQVGLVVVRAGPVATEATDSLRARLPMLQSRLSEAFSRYRSGGVPVYFQMAGPVDGRRPPAPRGGGVLDAARDSYEMWRYSREVDRRAGLNSSATDARIYLIVREPMDAKRKFVEGFGEQGGRVGVVEVELDDAMVDYALLVAVHELLHTIGATDKYDETGQALVPEGLAEPDLQPLYPQRYVEVMARGRPIAPGKEELPGSLDELGIGPSTAREIGLVKSR